MTGRKPLILWGVGTSRTIRPHWAMHELALDYESRPIGPRTGETKTAEYTALNPRQKIPLLQDDDFTIGESAAIVAYLSRTYSTSERSLIPVEPRQYAAWLEWCFFIVAELDSTSLYVMRRHGAVIELATHGDGATQAVQNDRDQPLRITRNPVGTGNRGEAGW